MHVLVDPFDPLYPNYREMSLSYAELETKLGEIDRARAIYSHGSQMSDPRVSGFIEQSTV